MSHYQWEAIDETEKVESPTDISFEKLVRARFNFNRLQRIKLVLTDGAIDGGEIGSAETSIGEIMAAEEYFKAQLFDSTLSTVGSIIVTLKEAVSVGDDPDAFLLKSDENREKSIRFKYRWENLNNWSSGFFGIGK